MASNAISGVGAKFQYWDSSAGEYKSLAEVNSISGPSKSRETIDVTSLDSDGGYREFIPSFRTGGNVSLTMNFWNDTYTLINGHFEDNLIHTYRICIPDTDKTALEFNGIVMELPLEISVGDKITANVTVQVTGKPVLTTWTLENDSDRDSTLSE